MKKCDGQTNGRNWTKKIKSLSICHGHSGDTKMLSQVISRQASQKQETAEESDARLLTIPFIPNSNNSGKLSMPVVCQILVRNKMCL